MMVAVCVVTQETVNWNSTSPASGTPVVLLGLELSNFPTDDWPSNDLKIISMAGGLSQGNKWSIAPDPEISVALQSRERQSLLRSH